MKANIRAITQVIDGAKRSRPDLDRLINRRLYQVLTSAYLHVPYYKDVMKKAGYTVPAWVLEMLDAGMESFYKSENGTRYFYDVASKTYKELEIPPQIFSDASVGEPQAIDYVPQAGVVTCSADPPTPP